MGTEHLESYIATADAVNTEEKTDWPKNWDFLTFVHPPQRDSKAEEQLFAFFQDHKLRRLRAIGKSNTNQGGQIQVPATCDNKVCAITTFTVQTAGGSKELKKGDTIALREMKRVLSSGYYIVDNMPEPA